MAFVSKLNYKSDGHLINDEIVVLSGGNKIYTIQHHNVMGSPALEVWTGTLKTGTKITDFTASPDIVKPWVVKITFGASVTNGTYYVTYKSQGDENDADDINLLQNEISGIKNKLITSYTHTSNQVIQPISVDLVTGIFTTDTPIGLSAGTKKDCLIAINFTKTNQLPREFKSIDQKQIEVIDNYSFYVLFSNARLTYPNAANTAVDVSSFRFEIYPSVGVTINLADIVLGKTRAIFHGSRNRAGWTYIYLNINDNGVASQHNFGTFADGRDMNSIYFELFFDIRGNSLLSHIDRYITSTWTETNGTWGQSHATSGQGISLFNRYKTTPTITSIQFTFGIANGSVIELYDIGGR
jgi:hypothetical protein